MRARPLAVMLGNSGPTAQVKGIIGGVPTTILLDTGATISILSEELANKLRHCKFEKARALASSVSGGGLAFEASVTVPAQVGHSPRVMTCFHVMKNATHDCILGTDYMSKLDSLSFDCHGHSVSINGGTPIPLTDVPRTQWKIRLLVPTPCPSSL